MFDIRISTCLSGRCGESCPISLPIAQDPLSHDSTKSRSVNIFPIFRTMSISNVFSEVQTQNFCDVRMLWWSNIHAAAIPATPHRFFLRSSTVLPEIQGIEIGDSKTNIFRNVHSSKVSVVSQLNFFSVKFVPRFGHGGMLSSTLLTWF